jgi:murein L,D-transpeptidase YcbB/YkuD
MREFRLGLLFAGTALAVVLAARSLPAYAANADDRAVESLVPMPDTTVPPPPTARDVSTPAAVPAAALAAPEAAPAATAAAPAAPSAAPVSQTAAVPALGALDQQVADKLREYLTGKADRIIERKSKQGVDAFYATRNYAPLWLDNGNPGERAKAVAKFLANVGVDGLDPADYPLPEIKAGADAGALADAELRYTETVLTYARHAQIGRVHFSHISPDISYNLAAPEPAEVLGKLTDAKDIDAALDQFNPPHAGYKALKAKLAEARAAKDGGGPARIAAGPVLKLVAKTPMQDPRVPLLRERLAIAGDTSDTTYDKTVAEAVKKFQDSHHLAASGQLTAATVDAINGPKRDREVEIILSNMERWRWLPRDLGKMYVMVNIPDFTLRVMKDGAQVWKTKIVSGQPGNHATPLLTETMKFITVNPTWNVPPSIINNEYLPALAQDSTVLDRMGLKLERNRDGSVRIYQPPGERNALGRIRFNFPNKFLVYQHDTPDKHLFAREVRDYSHGCMRVENPDKYAEVLLGLSQPQEGYTAERIRKMYGSGEVDIHLKNPIPVHITYQTAYVNDDGKLVIRDDIYGRDQRYFALMKSDERKVADVATETRGGGGTAVRPAKLPDGLFASTGSNGGSGGGLFGWLFSGGDRQATEYGAPRPRAQVQPQQRRTQANPRQTTYR